MRKTDTKFSVIALCSEHNMDQLQLLLGISISFNKQKKVYKKHFLKLVHHLLLAKIKYFSRDD